MRDSPFGHPAWVEIDSVQFKKNIASIKRFIGPHTKFCLPVKANAYGHGLIPIAQAGITAGVDYLAVSCLQEGALLRKAGIHTPILVLGAIHQEQIPYFIQYELEFTLASLFKAKLVSEVCNNLNKKVKVHIEVDTGMHRTGVRVETAPELLAFIKSESCFELKGVYSHLASADEHDNPFTQKQIVKFNTFIQEQELETNKDVLCHIANSAGLMYFPEAHLDMVRPGLLAFGYYPAKKIPERLNDIRPCFSIKARIAYFKVVPKGEGIGYNHRYIAPDNIHVITIPLGYGDGLRRSLSNKASILLKGKRYPIVGNICMDQCMVDIGKDSGFVGDIVTLVGQDDNAEISILEMSEICSTIPYEILCGFNNRLPRVYHTENLSQWENDIQSYSTLKP